MNVPTEWNNQVPTINEAEAWLFSRPQALYTRAAQAFHDFMQLKLRERVPDAPWYRMNSMWIRRGEILPLEKGLGSSFLDRRSLMTLLEHVYRWRVSYGLCAVDLRLVSASLSSSLVTFTRTAQPKELLRTLADSRGLAEVSMLDALVGVSGFTERPEFLGVCGTHEKQVCGECGTAYKASEVPIGQLKFWGWSKCANCGKDSLAKARWEGMTWKEKRKMSRISARFKGLPTKEVQREPDQSKLENIFNWR